MTGDPEVTERIVSFLFADQTVGTQLDHIRVLGALCPSDGRNFGPAWGAAYFSANPRGGLISPS
jgi:hypothetical protein